MRGRCYVLLRHGSQVRILPRSSLKSITYRYGFCESASSCVQLLSWPRLRSPDLDGNQADSPPLVRLLPHRITVALVPGLLPSAPCCNDDSPLYRSRGASNGTSVEPFRVSRHLDRRALLQPWSFRRVPENQGCIAESVEEPRWAVRHHSSYFFYDGSALRRVARSPHTVKRTAPSLQTCNTPRSLTSKAKA